MRSGLFLVLLAGHVAGASASVTAAGKHWSIAIGGIECEAAGARLGIAASIRYTGPKGLVEAPLARLVDAAGKLHPPKSLVWKSGDKALAPWLSRGGVAPVRVEAVGEVQLKFEALADGELKLEFGDIPAVALSRKTAGGSCDAQLHAAQIQAPRRLAAPPRADLSKTAMGIHRGAYPCTGTTNVEAQFPPYLPRQLLVFGRGYLPSARHVDLPMGKAPAQTYVYTGASDIPAMEAVVRQALAADYPEYRAPRYFVFDWGPQKAPSGNELYSVGIYERRACP